MPNFTKRNQESGLIGEVSEKDTSLLVGIQEKPLKTWTNEEVVAWLDLADLSQYKKVFAAQSLKGADLVDLSEKDLENLGMARLGHRKTFRRKIEEILAKESSATSKQSKSEDDSSGSSNKSGSKSGSTSSEYKFKCIFEDDTRVIVLNKSKARFRDLKKKIESTFERKMRIRYIDEDGDAISMRSSSDFKEAIEQSSNDVIRLKLSARSSSNDVARAEAEILEALLDGCIVIDTKGLIKYMNRAALNLFGLATPAKRIEQLMPDSIGKNHQSYLDRYVNTRKASIIGTGREVVGVHANGSTFPIHLSVTETRTSKRHTFTGVLRPITEKSGSRWDAYEGLIDAVLVINPKGQILYANSKVEQVLQYSPADLVGQKVNKIMLPFDAKAHDNYLSNYIRTGVSKIIGSGRKVLGQTKAGDVRPLNLTITQQKLGSDEVTFTGLIRPADDDKEEVTLLQTEREVIENLVVPACIIDERGIIQSFNSAASSVFGYSYVEVLGKNVKMLCNPEDKAKHDTYLSNYKKTGASKIIGKGREIVAARKNGSLFRLHLSINERSDGQITIFTAIMRPLEN